MAAVDYFLKISNITGELKQKGREKEIELLSWSWAASNTGTLRRGGGGGAGKVKMQDFRFSMYLNRASPRLALCCANGEHMAKATLTCRKAGGGQQEYYV